MGISTKSLMALNGVDIDEIFEYLNNRGYTILGEGKLGEIQFALNQIYAGRRDIDQLLND